MTDHLPRESATDYDGILKKKKVVNDFINDPKGTFKILEQESISIKPTELPDLEQLQIEKAEMDEKELNNRLKRKKSRGQRTEFFQEVDNTPPNTDQKIITFIVIIVLALALVYGAYILDQILFDNKNQKQCPDNKFFDEATGECDINCDGFWQKRVKGKTECVSVCGEGRSVDRYRKNRCIDIYQLYDESALFLSKQSAIKDKSLSQSLSKELQCKNNKYRTPFTRRKVNLKNYVFVELKVKWQQNEQTYRKIQMLMPPKSYKILNTYVNTTDKDTIQCTTNQTQCYSTWKWKIDHYYLLDYYYTDQNKWFYHVDAQIQDGSYAGFYREVWQDSTDVYWHKKGKIDGKMIKNTCQRTYFKDGKPDGTWTGFDLSKQYRT